MPSVVFADDHPLLLRGLQDLMAGAPEFDVVAATNSGARALSMIEALRPDMAVLDLSMPDLDGLTIQRSIVRQRLGVRTILLTAALTPGQIREALALDVWGVLLKDDAADALLDCMRCVARHRRWLPASMIERLPARHGDAGTTVLPQLTLRERDVARLVCKGYSNRVAAGELGISEGTVGIHLQNIYLKLGVRNRTMLAALHMRRELTGDA